MFHFFSSKYLVIKDLKDRLAKEILSKINWSLQTDEMKLNLLENLLKCYNHGSNELWFKKIISRPNSYHITTGICQKLILFSWK
jgi:hypothetical protein